MTDEEIFLLKLLLKILNERFYENLSDDKMEEGDVENNPWELENLYLKKSYLF
jgi:hypothetical protein